MDPESILATVRSGQVPSDWTVWPLRKDKVRHSGLEYLVIGLFGLVIFVPAAISTIPSNFEGGAFGAGATAVFLLLIGAVAFGGLGIAAYDFFRLANADRYSIVLTPDDFIMQTPRRIVHVPMEDVAYLTLKGVRMEHAPSPEDTLAAGGMLGGAGRMFLMRTRQPKQAPSLAFQDRRTGREVIVARDDSFEELSALEEILATYVFNKERRLRTG